MYLVAQLCLTLCDPMDCSPPGSSVHGDSPSKNTRVDCHALLQGIFPTQELNPSLPHCRQILYHLSHREAQGSRLQLENLMPFSLPLSHTHMWALHTALAASFTYSLCFQNRYLAPKNSLPGTSLVVQWLRLHFYHRGRELHL